MASRYEVEVTIASAKDLKNVNWRNGKLSPYAVVWVDSKAKCSTPVDGAGDTSPEWDHKLVIPFNSSIEDSTLYIDIVHAGGEVDTKPLIGSARLPLREIVDESGFGSRAERSLKLKRPSGRPQGKVQVVVSVREAGYRAPEPYYAPPPASREYGASPYGSPYGAPPPQHGYGAPPQHGYGAPPSDYPAYGAPPSDYPGYGGAPPSYGQGSHYGQPEYEKEKEKKEKKSSFGGMGTGLAVGAVAGVLGGIAISEGIDAWEDNIAEDVEERLEEEEEEKEREEEEEEEREEEEESYDD